MLEDQNLAIMFNKINHFADASLQLNATVNTNHYFFFYLFLLSIPTRLYQKI